MHTQFTRRNLKLRSRLLAVTLLMFSLNLVAQKNAEPTEWQDTAVVVDGLTDEYPELSRYMSDIKMLYFIGNDRENLYVVLKTYDETMLRKIMLSGIELGLDSTAKKRMKSVLKFPLGRGMAPRMPGERPEDEKNMDMRRPEIAQNNRIPEPEEMMLRGFKDIDEGLYPLQHASGIEVKAKGKRGEEFVYEAKIPFKTFFKPALTAADNQKVVSLTFHFAGFEQPEGMPMERPSQGGGQMGGRPGMEDRQGMQRDGQQRPDMEALAQEITIKRQFKLQFNDK